MRVKKSKKKWYQRFDQQILAGIVLVFILNTFVYSIYFVHNKNMEESLHYADYLYVSKLAYGGRLPITPLKIPFAKKNIWTTDVKSYLTWIQLPAWRFWALDKVQLNDIMVFNSPLDTLPPIDVKNYLALRCVGLPADTVLIKQKQLIRNSQAASEVSCIKHRYYLLTKKVLSLEELEKYNLSNAMPTPGGYVAFLNQQQAQALTKKDVFNEVVLGLTDPGVRNPDVYPHHDSIAWNEDHFGPLYIPKQGDTTWLNQHNLRLYGQLLTQYEYPKNGTISNQTFWVNNKPLEYHVWKQDYFFLLADNRHNGKDSRHFGLVPKSHVVGKGTHVILSLNPEETQLFKRIKWNRWFLPVL